MRLPSTNPFVCCVLLCCTCCLRTLQFGGPPTSTCRGDDSCASCSRRSYRWEAKQLEKISAHKVVSRPKVLSSETVLGLLLLSARCFTNSVSVHHDVKCFSKCFQREAQFDESSALGNAEPPVGHEETNNVQVIGAHTAHSHVLGI